MPSNDSFTKTQSLGLEIKRIVLLFPQFDFVVFANCFSFVTSTNSISDLQQTKIEH